MSQILALGTFVKVVGMFLGIVLVFLHVETPTSMCHARWALGLLFFSAMLVPRLITRLSSVLGFVDALFVIAWVMRPVSPVYAIVHLIGFGHKKDLT